MSEPADIATRKQRFNEAARAFKPPPPTRHAKLMPMKDGIIELRQKGASLRLIRELLATVNVAVGTDTIARFLAEVNGEAQSPQTSKRPVRTRRARARTAVVQSAAVAAAIVATTDKNVSACRVCFSTPRRRRCAEAHPTSTLDRFMTSSDWLPARSRARGPRIADPRNL